ncbi:hypothetical protein HRG_000696 [Hirsutella rhossiliensis]|uniref:Uncharacterized protein n=1 Tax=Hirsutella rhossiliensis TaxID=111463 RepID=A0A9P8N976_9HYPO|nr:uncharacterized protein HRG_00696 [Hirsutella rhossiliensis]KAH0968054.1 hypothetical protein HRG_00696 [Hirsutella rhossiliensis]
MSDFESQVHRAAARHAELLQVLADTDYSPAALDQQSRFIDNLDSQIGVSNQKLKLLNMKREMEHNELDKFRDSQVRRFMYKAACQQNKFVDKAEKGERHYSEVVQRVRRERNINADLRDQRKEAALSKRQLEAMAHLHVGAQRKLDKLYHSIFSGSTPHFPEENEAKRQCNRMEAAYHGARAAWEAESSAVQLLDKGDSLMDEALTRIRDALSYSRADRFAGGGVYDMMERNRVAQADQIVTMARLQVMRAQKASPQVQALPEVTINNGRVLRDVVSDDVFADRAFRKELKHAAVETQRCATELKGELDAARRRQGQLQAKLDRRAAELTEARAVLQKARERVFEAVLLGRESMEGGENWTTEAAAGRRRGAAANDGERGTGKEREGSGGTGGDG